MSSVYANPRPPESHEMEWARLIPGEIPETKKLGKKRPASVKPFVLEKDQDRESCAPEATEQRERTLEVWLPRPLQSRAAEKWMRSMVVDFALVALKTTAFGFFIAIVTCYHGLAQPLRLEDVSRVAVRAVSQGVIVCVLIDALFILLYLAT